MLSKLFPSLRIRINKVYIHLIYLLSKRFNKELDKDLTSSMQPLKDITLEKKYMHFHHSFWHKMPEWLRSHRSYFRSKQRGFGEDAFHSMWYFILSKYRPKNMLEIGVYRGQVISLWSLISDKISNPHNIHGISPFSNAGDQVSAYIDIDYLSDVQSNFKQLNLNLPTLHNGFSTDKSMLNIIKSTKWDLIYIDGSHDYKIVKQDFQICASSLSEKGLIVLDDSALYTSYKPPIFGSPGHPGPSTVANEIDKKKFIEILSIGHNRVFQCIK